MENNQTLASEQSKNDNNVTLSSAQRSALRSRAAPLDPVLYIGKNGVNEAVGADAENALSSRDLIKCRVLETSPDNARTAAEKLSVMIGATIVHVIGNTFVLFREIREKKAAAKRAKKSGVHAKFKPGIANKPGKSYTEARGKRTEDRTRQSGKGKQNGKQGNAKPDAKIRGSNARTASARVGDSSPYAETRKTDRSPARTKAQTNTVRGGKFQGERPLDGKSEYRGQKRDDRGQSYARPGTKPGTNPGGGPTRPQSRGQKTEYRGQGSGRNANSGGRGKSRT